MQLDLLRAMLTFPHFGFFVESWANNAFRLKVFIFVLGAQISLLLTGIQNLLILNVDFVGPTVVVPKCDPSPKSLQLCMGVPH